MAYNLLITSTGGIRSSNLILQIKKKSKYRPLKVHAADVLANVQSKQFADSFTVLPKANNKKYIKEIIKIVRNKSINLIIPGSDEEAMKLSKEKKIIEKKGAKVASVDYKILKEFKNKLKTYQKLKKLKISAPKWKLAKNFSELKLAVNFFFRLKLDVVVKPVNSRGGRNVSIIRKDIKNIIKKNFGREIHMSKKCFFLKFFKNYSNLFPVIVMERLYEPSYDFDLLSWQGKLLKVVVRKRIGSQGIGGNVIEVPKKNFLEYAKKIAKGFNLSWLYDCDIMMNKNSNPILMELNPRISGSVSASLEAGIPLIDDLISLAKKKFSKVKATNLKKNITVIPYSALSKILKQNI